MADEKKVERPETVEVVAIQPGHDGRRTIAQGERFTVPASRLKDGSTWFVRAEMFKPVKRDPLARPPGAGPVKGSAVPDEQQAPGAGPVPGSGPRSGGSDALA